MRICDEDFNTARDLVNAFNPLSNQLPFELLRHRQALEDALAKVRSDAFKAGAEAMREAAAKECDDVQQQSSEVREYALVAKLCAVSIRKLPVEKK